ncbi:hypothetical protein CC80DRAFT_499046 [Byssothecium circinans]|uniref:Zn(2)-C6 fungal-type domain-containing protein n=1 Tax=Byssothecium circinans TaxID=147558 RepID=A0A6A5UIG9_9PLEO|nr:hypothetical protein CC80DRAFT_499046 [Byssothecium circinans]
MPPPIPSSVLRALRAPATTTYRALSTTPQMSIKEDADRTPEQLEKKKQESLKKQEKGEGHWHEELGSASESNVAADREKVSDHDSHMGKLQQETKEKGEKGEIKSGCRRPPKHADGQGGLSLTPSRNADVCGWDQKASPCNTPLTLRPAPSAHIRSIFRCIRKHCIATSIGTPLPIQSVALSYRVPTKNNKVLPRRETSLSHPQSILSPSFLKMPEAQRSRACQQCRQRRVKCDETPEICQQCSRLELKCSGPIQGSVIIDMTNRVARPRQRKKRGPKSAATKSSAVRKDSVVAPKEEKHEIQSDFHNPERVETPMAPQFVPQHWKPAVDRWTEVEANSAITTIRHQYRMPALYQPSKVVPEALDMAFITHFVQLLQGLRSYNREIPWITHLPDLGQNASRPALRLSIRAASMAFYATVHRDPTILVDSYRWYTISLNCQRKSLDNLGADSIPSDEEILVPVILSLYEVFAGTTTTSIWHHLKASTNIIAMRGPKNITGSIYPLFKAMRVSEANISTIFNTVSVFASSDWMTIPFANCTKNAQQLLVDILLQIPACISLCRTQGNLSLRKFFGAPLAPGIDLRPAEQRTRELLREIEKWALRFPSLTCTGGGESIVAADDESLVTNGVKPATPDGSYVILPDSYVALMAATYGAIRLILSLLLDKVSVGWSRSPTVSVTSPISPSSVSFTSPIISDAIGASQAVLKNSAHMESSHPVGFDFMRCVFPVVVTATLAPRLEDQMQAEEMLRRWGKKKGMSGLCAAWLDV